MKGCGGGPQELWGNWLVWDEKSLYRELSDQEKKDLPCIDVFPTGALKKFQRREILITVGCARRVSFVDENMLRFYLWALLTVKKNPGIHQLQNLSPVLMLRIIT